MSLIQKLYDAEENKDLEKYNEVLSEDYVWVQHSTGKHIPREELGKWFMSDDAPKTDNKRIIYENDEIGLPIVLLLLKMVQDRPLWQCIL